MKSKDLPIPVVVCESGTESFAILRTLSFEADIFPFLS